MIIPNITEHGEYNNVTNKIPMCILRQFPSTIEHCIEWGKDKFEEYFNENIKIINNFIYHTSDYINKYKEEENKIEKLKKIKTLLSFIINKDISEIIHYALNYILKIILKKELYFGKVVKDSILFYF